MAVYTVLEPEQLEAFIQPFGIGPLIASSGASDGVENTTYFLTTDYSQINDEHFAAEQREWVLTLFEQLEFEQLDFYIQLTSQLSEYLPVPAPVRDYNGQALQTLEGKPALLYPRASGQHPSQPNEAQVIALASALAQLHQLGQQSTLSCDNPRSIDWICNNTQQLLTQVEADEAAALQRALDDCRQYQAQIEALPQSIIHNDLFSDNTLFNGNELSAIIDFYNAGPGTMLLDVAICVNDWCRDGNGFKEDLYRAFIDTYSGVRSISEEEKTLWPACLRIAALRFWGSRRLAQLRPKNLDGLHISKDPSEYRQLWQAHFEQNISW